MKETTKAFLREIVAPTAARLGLPAVAAQFKREGIDRDEFLRLCNEAWNGATVVPDDANTDTQPSGAPAPTEPPPAVECGKLHTQFDYVCSLLEGHTGDHRNGNGVTWAQ